MNGYDDTWAKFSGTNLIVEQIGTKNSLAIEADGVVNVTQNNGLLLLGNQIEFSQLAIRAPDAMRPSWAWLATPYSLLTHARRLSRRRHIPSPSRHFSNFDPQIGRAHV